jgi:hypothetical protein
MYIFIAIKKSETIQTTANKSIEKLPVETHKVETAQEQQSNNELVESIADMASPAPPLTIPSRMTETSDDESAKIKTKLEIPIQDLEQTATISDTLEHLNINVVTSNKAIIEGMFFKIGDYIDTNNRIKLLAKKGNALVFEVDRVAYSIIP